MAGLFKKKKVETKSESKVDPYGGLPDWAQDYYEEDAATASGIIDSASQIADYMAANPQQFADMSPNEQAALQQILSQSAQSDSMINEARAILDTDLYGKDPATLAALEAYGDDPSVLAALQKYNSDDPAVLAALQSYTGGGHDPIAALDGDRYRSSYTDEVVDTTLAGMDRNAAREQMARGASEAAIGGTGSTRAAVADALSSQLYGMDRAQAEASLRDDAERFAAEMGMSEAQFLDEMNRYAAEYGMSEAQFLDSMNRYGSEYGLQEAGFRDDRDRYGFEAGMQEAQFRDDRERFASDLVYKKSDAIGDLAMSNMDIANDSALFQSTYGAMERDIQNQRYAAEYLAPMDALSWETDIFNSTRQLPSTGAQSTSQVNTAPGKSTFQQILGGAAQVAGIWAGLPTSDIRAKENIEIEHGALDKLRDVGSFSYHYRDGLGLPQHRTSGLMAQDLERANITGAVIEGPDGIKRVDPYPVLATVVQAVRELDARTRAQAGLEAA